MAYICRHSLLLKRNLRGILKFPNAKTSTQASNESSLDKFYFGDQISDHESNILRSEFTFREDFINPIEELEILTEIELYLQRSKFQIDYRDDIIHGFGYNETDHLRWTTGNSAVIEKIRNFVFPQEHRLLPRVHVLDMACRGHINIRICSDIVTGVSLLSDSTMRLTRNEDGAEFDVLLKRRSLFIMKGKARNDFTHKLLPDTEFYADPECSEIEENNGREPNEENKT